MSRSGYSDDGSGWDLIRWRGQVASATRGQRGQRLLRDLLDALESMPEKRLHAGVFDDGKGCVCALGAVARLRGVDVAEIEPDRHCGDLIAPLLDIAYPLAAEVMFVNDEGSAMTPEARWVEVYGWAREHFKGGRLPFAPRPLASCSVSTGEETAAEYPFRVRRPLFPDECHAMGASAGDCSGSFSRCADASKGADETGSE